jgi:zinc protease
VSGLAALPLGATPVLLPAPDDPTVSLAVACRVGSQDDPPGKEGLAHLTARLMAEGATTRRAYPEILDLLYPTASSYRVRVDKERTTFTSRTHADNVPVVVPLFLDALLRPAFGAGDFARLRERTASHVEKTLRYASDEELGKAALHGEVFAGTRYGHLVEGTAAGLAAITLDDVRRFYAEHFTRDTALLGLGGRFEATLVERLAAGLTALPQGAPPAVPVPRARAVAGRRVVIVEKPGPATAISFGAPLDVRRGERDFYAFWLANSWLGEHRNSAAHLYQVIRERRGLNYGDYSYIEWFPEGGMRTMPPPGAPRRRQLFEVWLRPVPEEAALFALRAAVREVDGLVRDGLAEEAFESTRTFLLKYSLHFAETTSARLGYAIDDRFYGIQSPGHLARFREEIASLTCAEVTAAVRRNLSTENVTIAIVTANAAAIAEALAADAPSPIVYATPKPAAVLDEDESIAVYPLHIDRADVRIVPVEGMFAT